MSAVLERPDEHLCSCGATARVWVAADQGDHEPVCRRCAADREPADDVVLLPRLARREHAQAGAAPLKAGYRRCEGCGLATTPAALAMHQKANGHVGWEAAR